MHLKISTFLKKLGDEAEVVQCPFKYHQLSLNSYSWQTLHYPNGGNINVNVIHESNVQSPTNHTCTLHIPQISVGVVFNESQLECLMYTIGQPTQ